MAARAKMQSRHLDGAHFCSARQASPSDLECFQQGWASGSASHHLQSSVMVTSYLAIGDNTAKKKDLTHKNRRSPGVDGGKYAVLMEKILRSTP